MKIAAQNTQLDVAAESLFSAIPTPPHAVAGLQSIDDGLDSGMPLPRLAELDAGLLFLLCGLPGSRHRQARMSNDLRQGLLVLRRVEAPVERGPLDATAQTLLQPPRLFHDHIAVILLTRHQVRMGDEADGILKDQHLASELHRLGGLATLVQLGVRLKDAEELVAVGNRLAFQNPAGGSAADLPGQHP